MKKLVSALLAVIMVIGIFVIPASATGMEPRYPVVPCDKCGELSRSRDVLITVDPSLAVPSCPNFNFFHYHDLYIYSVYIDCPNCGSHVSYTYTREVCP